MKTRKWMNLLYPVKFSSYLGTSCIVLLSTRVEYFSEYSSGCFIFFRLLIKDALQLLPQTFLVDQVEKFNCFSTVWACILIIFTGSIEIAFYLLSKTLVVAQQSTAECFSVHLSTVFLWWKEQIYFRIRFLFTAKILGHVD